MTYSKKYLPPEDQLLRREEFDKYIRLRSNDLCIFCPLYAEDAHHILERKLFPDGGYYLGNGAAVCAQHHWDVEMTTITVEQVRAMAGIKKIILPPGFFENRHYDKWGNEIVSHKNLEARIAGPLKDDDGMKKALKLGKVYYLIDLDTI